MLQLKEKDELDLLLCDLLLQMGYITDNRPETGNRQYGVDIRAHNQREILLCVVKQKNIDRKLWDAAWLPGLTLPRKPGRLIFEKQKAKSPLK